MSPLRLPIPPLGQRVECSLCATRPLFGRRRGAAPGGRAVLLPELADPAIQLIAERKLFRALHRRQKAGQILLLRFENFRAAMLGFHEPRHVLVDFGLVG